MHVWLVNLAVLVAIAGLAFLSGWVLRVPPRQPLRVAHADRDRCSTVDPCGDCMAEQKRRGA